MAEDNNKDKETEEVKETAETDKVEVNSESGNNEDNSTQASKELSLGEKLLNRDISGKGSSLSALMDSFNKSQIRSDYPSFRAGDTIRVHAKIVEGSKERIQVFEGIVLKRSSRNGHSGTFTVRKISNNVGVERTFLLHSPNIEKIELVTQGVVRRARLFYLRERSGKAARIKSLYDSKKKSRTATS